MNSRGAIICFQKYTIGNQINSMQKETHQNHSPVCLGYFNRVDVKPVNHFRDYVKGASKHEAERICSRKQLLLRKVSQTKLNELHEQIDFLASSDLQHDVLPFVGSGGELFMLGCCSVLSVKTGDKREYQVSKGQCMTNQDFACQLFQKIKEMQDGHNFRFAILELLGTEDLCLIILSNKYQDISDVIMTVQSFHCNGCSQQTVSKVACHIDNMHSILMIDSKNAIQLSQSDWGDAKAEIQFSVRGATGLKYLNDVKNHLNKRLSLDNAIELVGSSGEYDAVLRCPAHLLVPTLFGETGYFSPNNNCYQKSVYQSETFVYPFALNSYREEPNQFDSRTKADSQLTKIVKDAIDALRTNLNFAINDLDFECVELPLWRLLKDYWSFASFPMNDELRQDLDVQFEAAVNAIVRQAEICIAENNMERFLQEYDRILEAISNSMQTGSQQDRWTFSEQHSHTQNIGSYYKILRCYYGIIKDFLTLIYHIERENVNDQPILIPLLSFGITPIIKSDSYFTQVSGNNARLICIKLPYQALANPPKYLSMLAHEIFHYAAPAERAMRNELTLKAVLRIALTEFISILAKAECTSEKEDYWKQCFTRTQADRDYFNELTNYAYNVLANSIDIEYLNLKSMEKFVLPQVIYFTTNPSKAEAYNFYFDIWSRMREGVRIDIMESSLSNVHENDNNNTLLLILALDSKRFFDDDISAYNGILEKIEIEYVQQFEKLIINTFKAMEECPPDIFDLETVLYGEDECKKIMQYLWQIHGTKREMMMNSMARERSQDISIRDMDKKFLNMNDIRIAMIINCYLKRDSALALRKGPLSSALEDWVPQTGKYAENFNLIKAQFIWNFDYVMSRFEGLVNENTAICMMIIERISILKKDLKCSKIMQKLSGFYKTYYNLLDERQRSALPTAEQTYASRLFSLCCELIDAYQTQDVFDIQSSTSLPVKNAVYPKIRLETPSITPWSKLAYISSDISYVVDEACKCMKIQGKDPVLWYRGQRQADWETLPNIMRIEKMKSSNPNPPNFANLLKDEMRWARAYLLPTGMEFSDAEWLAYLQHYEFKTSVLDFSESLYPALYFATEDWNTQAGCIPEVNAVLMILNPVLFNLAMELLEVRENGDVSNALFKLRRYLLTGTQYDHPPLFSGELRNNTYGYLYDFSDKNQCKYPRAVMVPRHCERMDKQSGEFIYYGVQTPRCPEEVERDGIKITEYNYNCWSLESLHDKYYEKFLIYKDQLGVEDFVPFLYRIEINRFRYSDFKKHLLAIGMRKYSVYPEHDKLAFDLRMQLGMD